jgi:hypothetical protein
MADSQDQIELEERLKQVECEHKKLKKKIGAMELMKGIVLPSSLFILSIVTFYSGSNLAESQHELAIATQEETIKENDRVQERHRQQTKLDFMKMIEEDSESWTQEKNKKFRAMINGLNEDYAEAKLDLLFVLRGLSKVYLDPEQTFKIDGDLNNASQELKKKRQTDVNKAIQGKSAEAAKDLAIMVEVEADASEEVNERVQTNEKLQAVIKTIGQDSSKRAESEEAFKAIYEQSSLSTLESEEVSNALKGVNEAIKTGQNLEEALSKADKALQKDLSESRWVKADYFIRSQGIKIWCRAVDPGSQSARFDVNDKEFELSVGGAGYSVSQGATKIKIMLKQIDQRGYNPFKQAAILDIKLIQSNN